MICEKYKKAIVVFVIVLLGFFLQKNYINEFPSYIHAWTQADRLAIANGFVNNGLDFFKPETYVYNHQFPHGWQVVSDKSITSVDFPLHDYIPAVFMKLFNSSSLWIFRLYILIYSFVGLFFLYKLSYLLTQNFFKSIFVVLFAATSPVFVYYQSGFLPTIPSFANAVIGLYFYLYYILKKSDSSFNISIVFLTLATLSRTTFVIPFIAVLVLEFIRVILGNSKVKSKLVSVVCSISIIAFFYLYNSYLRNQYGSLFLNSLMPPNSYGEIIEIVKAVKNNWLFQYLSAIHYVILILITVVSFFFINKSRVMKLVKTTFLLCAITFIGCIAFTFIMMRQFPAHDYYFLDTFFLPILIMLIVSMSMFPELKLKNRSLVYTGLVVLIGLPLIVNASNSQKSRRLSVSNRTMATINNFDGADKYLDSLGISQTSKMLVIDTYAPNIPFLKMKRKGFAVMTTSRENIETAIGWDYDYIVMQNDFFLSDIYSQYPEIIDKTKVLYDNGSIMVCVASESETKQSLFGYLGFANKKPLFADSISFDSIIGNRWSNTNETSEYYFSGNKSGVLEKNMPYGLSYKTSNLPEITHKNTKLVFQSYFLRESDINVELVVCVSEGGEKVYYSSHPLQNMLKNTGVWEQVNLVFGLPKVEIENYELAVYLWNRGESELYVDDFGFIIY